jgi:hypothetical protein
MANVRRYKMLNAGLKSGATKWAEPMALWKQALIIGFALVWTYQQKL